VYFIDVHPQLQAIQEKSMPIEEGKKAPPFTLSDAHGNRVSLNDFAGQDLVIYFYSKDNTSG
jgi:peroxiredoxin Q/BCP